MKKLYILTSVFILSIASASAQLECHDAESIVNGPADANLVLQSLTAVARHLM
jgi:hypothetical protein